MLIAELRRRLADLEEIEPDDPTAISRPNARPQEGPRILWSIRQLQSMAQ